MTKKIQTSVEGVGVFFVRKTHMANGKLVTLIAGHLLEDAIPDIGTGSGQVWVGKLNLRTGRIYKNPDNSMRIDQELTSCFDTEKEVLLSDINISATIDEIEKEYFK